MRVCRSCRAIYSTPIDRCGHDGTPIVDSDVDPLVGQELDRYRVLEALGRGAMGCVYRAKHAVLDSECALKVLYGNFALNERLMERFRREAHAIGMMRHPNVVDVVDFVQTPEGLTFLVMELVHGRTLEEAIRREAPFSPARTAAIARQVAAGLGEAHRRGFVHRDMKPANVMLSEGDGVEVVKVLDFGVVGLIKAAASLRLTAAGHIVGTPSYMAPEQAQSSTVGPPADLYALGVMMYEMLSGRPPFEGGGVTEVLLKHLNQPPRPLRPSLGLERVVMMLLEKDADRRLGSTDALVRELDRLDLRGTETMGGATSSAVSLAATIPAVGAYLDTVADALPEASESPTEAGRVGLVAPTLPVVVAVPSDSETELDLGPSPSLPRAPRGGTESQSAVDTHAVLVGLEDLPPPLPGARTIRDTPRGGLVAPSIVGVPSTTVTPLVSPSIVSGLRKELARRTDPAADDGSVRPDPSETLRLPPRPEPRQEAVPGTRTSDRPRVVARPPRPAEPLVVLAGLVVLALGVLLGVLLVLRR